MFYTKLVGVAYRNEGANSENRQDIIASLCRQGKLNRGERLTLVPEPQNPYDANAIAVIGPDGRQLGYLSRAVAETISRAMHEGQMFCASVECVTGGDIDSLYGVNIKIEEIKQVE